MNKKLIIANWKMNPATSDEAEELSRATQVGAHGLRGLEVVLCPPFPYLAAVNLQISIVRLGAQDCFYEQKGAYTGAVSPAMLKDIGCEYVIIGHSERKQYFGETDEIINKKIKAALKAGLKVVLCIGEDTRDSFDSRGRWTHELDPKVKEQLVGALLGIKKSQISNVVIAYEPVWAIGTGNPANPDDVLSAKIFIVVRGRCPDFAGYGDRRQRRDFRDRQCASSQSGTALFAGVEQPHGRGKGDPL